MCPLCTSTSLRPCRRSSPGLALQACLTCGHTFKLCRDDENNREVQLQYFGDAFTERQGPLFDLYQTMNVGRTLRNLKLEGGKRVLEIGPGSGMVMACLARQGHNVHGLDLSPAVARTIKQRWGLTVHIERLDAHKGKVGAEYYDIIIMRHVLEHFSRPDEALVAIHSLLKPEGVLHVAVPNMESWNSRFSGWSGYQPYHLHYFNRRSLTWALTHAGFRVKRLSTYETLTGWPNAILHSVFKRASSQVTAPWSRISGLKRNILELIRFAAGVGLSPARFLQSLLGKGEELSVLAEKIAS